MEEKTNVIPILFLFLIGISALIAFLIFHDKVLVEDKEDDYSTEDEEKYEFMDTKIYLTLDSIKYEISFEDDYISVMAYSKDDCEEEPCKDNLIEKIKTDYKEDYYEFLEDFVYYADENLYNEDGIIFLEEEDLNRKQKMMFYEILEIKHENDISYKYTAHTDISNYKKRGYFVKAEENGDYTLIITGGEKDSSGYSMEIVSIKTYGDNVTIYVKEDGPEDEEVKDERVSSPVALVRFTRKPIINLVYSISENEEFIEIE